MEKPTRDEIRTARRVMEYLIEECDIREAFMSAGMSLAMSVSDHISADASYCLNHILTNALDDAVLGIHRAMGGFGGDVDEVTTVMAAAYVSHQMKVDGIDGAILSMLKWDEAEAVGTIGQLAEALGVEVPDDVDEDAPFNVRTITGSAVNSEDDFFGRIDSLTDRERDRMRRALVAAFEGRGRVIPVPVDMSTSGTENETRHEHSHESEPVGGEDEFSRRLREQGVL